MLDPIISFVVAMTALATALTTLVVAITAMIAALRNSRRIGRVHSEVNGRLDQLVSASSQLAYREGWEHGQVDPAALPPPDDQDRGRSPPKSGNP